MGCGKRLQCRVVYQPKSKSSISKAFQRNGCHQNRSETVSGGKQREAQRKWKEEFKTVRQQRQSESIPRTRAQHGQKDHCRDRSHIRADLDKDAGSKTTFQYLKMFLKKGYVVKFIEIITSMRNRIRLRCSRWESRSHGQEYLTGIWDHW